MLAPNMRFEVKSKFNAGNGLVILQCAQIETLDPLIDFSSGVAADAISTKEAHVFHAWTLSDLTCKNALFSLLSLSFAICNSTFDAV